MVASWMLGGAGGERSVPNNEIYAPVSTVTASTYTAASADVNTLVLVNNSGGCTVTLPRNLPEGAAIQFVQYGAGAVSFVAGTGATLPQTTPASPSQYAFVGAVVVSNPGGASAIWLITGV